MSVYYLRSQFGRLQSLVTQLKLHLNFCDFLVHFGTFFVGGILRILQRNDLNQTHERIDIQFDNSAFVTTENRRKR